MRINSGILDSMKRWKGSTKKSGTSRTYNSWRTMRQRCANSKHKAWPYYGGRGISVCKRWDSFERFLYDMGTRPSGTTLDRVDGSKGYSKENCRWARKTTQQKNTRAVVWIEHDEKRLRRSEWAKRLGISVGTIIWRAKQGWSMDKILNTNKHKIFNKAYLSKRTRRADGTWR